MMRKKRYFGLFLQLIFFILLSISASAQLQCTENYVSTQPMPYINITFDEEVYLYNPYLLSEDESILPLVSYPEDLSLMHDSFLLSPITNLVPGKEYVFFLNYSDYFLNFDYLADTCIKLDIPPLGINVSIPKYGVFNSSSNFFMHLSVSRQALQCDLYNYKSGESLASFDNLDNFSFSKSISRQFNNYDDPISYNHTYSRLPEYEIVCLEGTSSNNVESSRIIRLGYDTTKPNIKIAPRASYNTYSNMLVKIDSLDDEVLCKFDEKNTNKTFDAMRYYVTPKEERYFSKRFDMYLSYEEDSPYPLSLYESRNYAFSFICMNRAGFYSDKKDISFFINRSATFEIKDIQVNGMRKEFVGNPDLSVYVITNLDLSAKCTITSEDRAIESINAFPSKGLLYHNFSEESFYLPGKNDLLVICENGQGTVLSKTKTVYLDVIDPLINNITIPSEICSKEAPFVLNYAEQNPVLLSIEIKEPTSNGVMGSKEIKAISASPFESSVPFNASENIYYQMEITLVDIANSNAFSKSNMFRYNPLSPSCGDSNAPRTVARTGFSDSKIRIDLNCYDDSYYGMNASGCSRIYTFLSKTEDCEISKSEYSSKEGNHTLIELTAQDVEYMSLCYFSKDKKGNSEEPKTLNLYVLFLENGLIDQEPEPRIEEEDMDKDTDLDGMPDYWEILYGFNITDASDAKLDFDGDGLTNLEEYNLGTNPTKEDTDGDGYTDKEEVDAGTDPLDPFDKPKKDPPLPPPEDKKSNLWAWILLILGLLLIISGTAYLNLDEIQILLGLKERPIKMQMPQETRNYEMSQRPNIPSMQRSNQPVQTQALPGFGKYDSKLSNLNFLGKFRKSLFKEKQKKRSTALDSFDASISGANKGKGSELDNIPTYDEASKKDAMHKILEDIINKKVNTLEKEGELPKGAKTKGSAFERLSQLSDKHKKSIFDELDSRLGSVPKREIDSLIRKDRSTDFEKLDNLGSKKQGVNLDKLIDKSNKKEDLDSLIVKSKGKGDIDNLVEGSNKKDKNRKDKSAIDDLKKF